MQPPESILLPAVQEKSPIYKTSVSDQKTKKGKEIKGNNKICFCCFYLRAYNHTQVGIERETISKKLRCSIYLGARWTWVTDISGSLCWDLDDRFELLMIFRLPTSSIIPKKSSTKSICHQYLKTVIIIESLVYRCHQHYCDKTGLQVIDFSLWGLGYNSWLSINDWQQFQVNNFR